jgi:hypothetical protein
MLGAGVLHGRIRNVRHVLSLLRRRTLHSGRCSAAHRSIRVRVNRRGRREGPSGSVALAAKPSVSRWNLPRRRWDQTGCRLRLANIGPSPRRLATTALVPSAPTRSWLFAAARGRSDLPGGRKRRVGWVSAERAPEGLVRLLGQVQVLGIEGSQQRQRLTINDFNQADILRSPCVLTPSEPRRGRTKSVFASRYRKPRNAWVPAGRQTSRSCSFPRLAVRSSQRRASPRPGRLPRRSPARAEPSRARVRPKGPCRPSRSRTQTFTPGLRCALHGSLR